MVSTPTQHNATTTAGGKAVDLARHHAIEQHYFYEARLLQNADYRTWLKELVAPDIHYWMPIVELRMARDKRPPPTPDDAAIFNDDYDVLTMRVERMYTGQVWMEDPASRIRYTISNVEAFHTDRADEFEVYSNFVIHRHRRQDERSVHVGGREDVLRSTASGYQLVRRKINLDARVVQDKNLYFFA